MKRDKREKDTGSNKVEKFEMEEGAGQTIEGGGK